jgi:hypothetical protein
MNFWSWLTRRRDDHGWPAYIINGRIRTSTAGLIVAFFAVLWLQNAYQPPPESTTPATQVVPPGFMPDPEYTWVPRTNVDTRTRTPTRTATSTTETTPTTTESETSGTETTTSDSETSETSGTTTPTSGVPTTVIDPDGSGPAPATTVVDPDGSGPVPATTVVDPDGPGLLPPTTIVATPSTSAAPTTITPTLIPTVGGGR